MVEPIIKLRRTFEEAMSFRDSPINQFYANTGIQLLPNNEMKYVQVTDVEAGINLEDWIVKIVNLKTGDETDISEYFFVEALTNDSNGFPQIYWSLDSIPFDFGWNCVYLKVEQVFGEIFYSNPFLLTDYKKERTTQYHYKEYEDDPIQSIGLQTYFRQIKRTEELEKYYNTSTGITVNASVKRTKLEEHFTEIMSFELIDLLLDILSSPILYLDSIRCHLQESVPFPEAKGDENFSSIRFLVCPDKKDIYEEPQPSRGDWLADDFDSNDFAIYN